MPEAVPAQLVARLAHAFLADEMAIHAPKVDPAMNPKIFPEFAGKYDYAGATMVITIENIRLYAKLGGQEKYEIFLNGPDKFFWESRGCPESNPSGMPAGKSLPRGIFRTG